VTNLARKPATGTSPGTLDEKKGPFPCYTHVTMADVLDAKNVSWKYYAPAIGTDTAGTLWSAFSAIKAVYEGADWKNDVSPPTSILTDVKNGTLPSVSWVVPDFVNSDHPGAHSATGPSWVASVVNAIGKSKYWKSTAIVVVWDDYGGWFDPVPPPQKDYLGLAMRVPCLIVSPYAKPGHVDHTQYEFASVLKTIEKIFGLASMGTTDVRASAMFPAFDFTHGPQKFVPVPQEFSTQFFEEQAPSRLPPDND
jgi:phospholipase C